MYIVDLVMVKPLAFGAGMLCPLTSYIFAVDPRLALFDFQAFRVIANYPLYYFFPKACRVCFGFICDITSNDCGMCCIGAASGEMPVTCWLKPAMCIFFC